MNLFKKAQLLIILLLATQNIFSQLDITPPFYRDYEFQVYSDTSAHTNIKPYKYDYEQDTTHLNITFSPFLYANSGYDTEQKRFSYNYQAGLGLHTKYIDKISSNFYGFYGIYKQPQFTDYQADSLQIIPQYGHIPNFENNKNNIYKKIVGNFDFTPQKYLNFSIGNSKFFLGDGYRSLFLSDNSAPYPYFSTTVEIWKVKYLYLIARQKDFDDRYSTDYGNLYPKYTFTHYLSFNLFKRLNFSMFETVVQSTYDSLGLKRGLELNYLNPVIFYRAVELSQGSPDNVLVGFSGHLKIFKSAMLYGQIFIDEFIFSHIKNLDDEYWDEKYGIQAGFKNYNTLNIKNLYTQIEFNAVRPYTYSHDNPIGAYTNTLQPLAHPLGANFVEGIGIIGYNYKNIMLQGKFSYAKFGDNDTVNYGRNPTLSYNSHLQGDNINWLQGVSKTLVYSELSAGYEKYEYFARIRLIYRNLQSPSDITKNTMIMFDFGIQLFNDYYDY